MAQIINPDILDYGLGKTRGYVQSGPTSITPDSFTFTAYIDIQTGGAINSARVQGGFGFLNLHGPQNLTIADGLAEFRSTIYLNQGSLDSDFPNDSSGNYVLKIDSGLPGGSLGGGFDYSVPFKLGGDAYAADLPQLTLSNGAWSAGTYVLDPSNPTAFGWTFNSFNPATDMVLFSIDTLGGTSLVQEKYQGSNPGGFTFSGLTPGASYTGRLTFARIVDTPTDVPGVPGVAFYANETSFSFTAIPEPSTYALLALGLGMLALPLLRRRSAR